MMLDVGVAATEDLAFPVPLTKRDLGFDAKVRSTWRGGVISATRNDTTRHEDNSGKQQPWIDMVGRERRSRK